MKPYDYLIVGSGLFGSTVAYKAHQLGKKCLVIDKRPHIGGNIYCENIEGINVHKYGAHIFHTSNKVVWDFVNSIVPFNRYTNCPLAVAPDGRIYNLPFNMNTFYQMWGVLTPKQAKYIIEKQRVKYTSDLLRKGIMEPRNLEEQAISLVGQDLYEALIKGYTEKQWGRSCSELPAFIIKRLPLRFVFDNNYFNDTFQGVPIGGYNKLIEGLLTGVEVLVEADFFENRSYWESIAERIVYTGKIDEFYNYQFGKLEYRTVGFETEILNTDNYQGNAVVNYTSKDVPFTRIIEHKHFEAFGSSVSENPKTVISKEYPTEWTVGREPFYPINNERNNDLYDCYFKLTQKETKVVFGGRLAEYKYYDMAPIIEKVLKLKF